MVVNIKENEQHQKTPLGLAVENGSKGNVPLADGMSGSSNRQRFGHPMRPLPRIEYRVPAGTRPQSHRALLMEPSVLPAVPSGMAGAVATVMAPIVAMSRKTNVVETFRWTRCVNFGQPMIQAPRMRCFPPSSKHLTISRYGRILVSFDQSCTAVFGCDAGVSFAIQVIAVTHVAYSGTHLQLVPSHDVENHTVGPVFGGDNEMTSDELRS